MKSKTLIAIWRKIIFSMVFKKDMGISVMKYIKQRRMILADSLLYGGEKPVQAIYKSGYTIIPIF